ncbi:hypothetical protein AVEN_161417-1 [Araneus ventricosus]|uniref:THAP-type domain-containing protein n=1 Tax=Araneus ventricosus TaxID=182803 RepID=A0A4Y2K155_ARAVE|nr:hypothetical protein AVEN_161417-1 [Araneus ventricosus]
MKNLLEEMDCGGSGFQYCILKFPKNTSSSVCITVRNTPGIHFEGPSVASSYFRSPFLVIHITVSLHLTLSPGNSEKLFFSVPKNPAIRKSWTNAMKRDDKRNPKLSNASSLWCCEDHFSLKDDMENYCQWMLTKNVKRLKLKTGTVPHRFDCQ